MLNPPRPACPGRLLRALSIAIPIAIVGALVAPVSHAWRYDAGTLWSDVTTDGAGAVFGIGASFEVSKLDDSTGQELWNVVVPGVSWGSSVALDGAGDVVTGGFHEVTSQEDLAVVKLSGATGAELWRFLLDEGDPDVVQDLTVDSSSDVLAAGALGNDFAVVKIDGSSGAEIWRHRIDGGGPERETAQAILVDDSDDVIAAGHTYKSTPEVGSDWLVVKLDGTTGAEVWRHELDGTSVAVSDSPVDNAVALAVTPTGDVIATGVLRNDPFVYEWNVVRLDGTTGTEVWRVQLSPSTYPTYWGPWFDVEVTGGDVLVAGSLQSTNGGRSFAVLELDLATGAENWRTELHGLDKKGGSHARSLRVDSAGDVFACGLADNSKRVRFGNDWDSLVVKLDGSTGEVLWRQEASIHWAATLALDSDEDPVVVTRGFPMMEFDSEDGTLGPVAGSKITVADRDLFPEKRKLTVLLKDDAIVTPPPGGTDDPVTAGATVRLWNPGTGENATFVLAPGAGWKGRGNPPGSDGYTYRDTTGASGPCKSLKVLPGRFLKLSCSARSVPIPFSLDEPSQGQLGVSLQLGSARPQCAVFGGDIKSDYGYGPGPLGRFRAKDAPAPLGSCPVP